MADSIGVAGHTFEPRLCDKCGYVLTCRRGKRDRGISYYIIIRKGIEIDVEREANGMVCGCSAEGVGGCRIEGQRLLLG